MADVKADFGDEVLEKLKEVGWFVVIALLRFLLEKVLGGSSGGGETDAETEHER